MTESAGPTGQHWAVRGQDGRWVNYVHEQRSHGPIKLFTRSGGFRTRYRVLWVRWLARGMRPRGLWSALMAHLEAESEEMLRDDRQHVCPHPHGEEWRMDMGEDVDMCLPCGAILEVSRGDD